MATFSTNDVSWDGGYLFDRPMADRFLETVLKLIIELSNVFLLTEYYAVCKWNGTHYSSIDISNLSMLRYQRILCKNALTSGSY